MSWTEEDYKALMRVRGQIAFKDAEKAAPKSKYRNVKTMVDGEKFDSKREAQYWAELRLRQSAGQISKLTRQVEFALACPTPDGLHAQVSSYVADFVFDDADGHKRIQDIKGQKETAMFALKRKWLFLQSGIEIEVVR